MNLQDNIIGFHNYFIKTENMDETVQFYGILGFKVHHSWSMPDFNLGKCLMMQNLKINSYI